VIVCKECFGNYNQDINSIAPAATCENKLMPTNSVPWENVYGRSIWFPIYILLQLIIWVGLAVWAVRKVEYHTVGFISFINRISIFTVLVIRIVYFSLLLTLNPVNWLHVYCHEVTIFDSQYPEHMVLCFLHVTFYQCMIIAGKKYFKFHH
jgi:prepilin signal peptidase PulO-like enzyme (type II secretory pathway)